MSCWGQCRDPAEGQEPWPGAEPVWPSLPLTLPRRPGRPPPPSPAPRGQSPCSPPELRSPQGGPRGLGAGKAGGERSGGPARSTGSAPGSRAPGACRERAALAPGEATVLGPLCLHVHCGLGGPPPAPPRVCGNPPPTRSQAGCVHKVLRRLSEGLSPSVYRGGPHISQRPAPCPRASETARTAGLCPNGLRWHTQASGLTAPGTSPWAAGSGPGRVPRGALCPRRVGASTVVSPHTGCVLPHWDF